MIVTSKGEPDMNTTEIRELTDADLDLVSGGMDPNYKQCLNGTTAGGPSGVYPASAECAVTVRELINAFLQGVEQGKGGGGRPK
jgi:hypothetical protein